MLWFIGNLLIIIYGVLLCLIGKFYKHISFGAGLGDLFWYGFIYLLILAHGYLLLNKKFDLIIIFLIFLLLWIFISLKATYFRGHEYKWNGKKFYE